MIISRYFVLFVVFSFMGWIYETTFCMVKSKKWENRGFLYGPIVPIYGVGAVSITALAELFTSSSGVSQYKWYHVFIVAYIGSVILEYSTSWFLEMKFHAFWWDYSRMPLNINGRVCVPYSIGFGFAGLLVVYIISPWTCSHVDWMPPLLMEFISLVLMGVLMVDLTLTVSALTHFERMVIAMDESVDRHMESFVETINEKKLSGVIIDGSRVAAGKIIETKDAAAEKLSETRDAAAGKLSETRDAAAERLAAEREKFSREKMEQIFTGMGKGSSLAVGRIKGFKAPKMNIGKRIHPDLRVMERVSTEMKKYHSKLQNVGNVLDEVDDKK